MGECYYSDCVFHSKDEPTCYKNFCHATEQQLIQFRHKRIEYLKTLYTDKDKLQHEISATTF